MANSCAQRIIDFAHQGFHPLPGLLLISLFAGWIKSANNFLLFATRDQVRADRKIAKMYRVQCSGKSSFARFRCGRVEQTSLVPLRKTPCQLGIVRRRKAFLLDRLFTNHQAINTVIPSSHSQEKSRKGMCVGGEGKYRRSEGESRDQSNGNAKNKEPEKRKQRIMASVSLSLSLSICVYLSLSSPPLLFLLCSHSIPLSLSRSLLSLILSSLSLSNSPRM